MNIILTTLKETDDDDALERDTTLEWSKSSYTEDEILDNMLREIRMIYEDCKKDGKEFLEVMVYQDRKGWRKE